MRTLCGTILAGVAAVGTQVAVAGPMVTAVNMSQPARAGLVTITYTLSEAPAVVTLDVQTNYTENAVEKWASIGGEHIWNAQGDVWKKVTTTSGTITWRPDHSWKDSEGNGFRIDGTSRKARAVVTAWPLNNTPDYMVVDLSDTSGPNAHRYYPAVDFLPGAELGQTGAITNNPAYKTMKLLMRKIMAKGVTWTRGSASTEPGRTAAREQSFSVTLTNNYYIGVFELTQGQWAQVATNSASAAYFTASGEARPMENISYNELRNTHNTSKSATTVAAGANGFWPDPPSNDSFLGLLRLRTGLDFDLPSQSQWEFAARAGRGSPYWPSASGKTIEDSAAGKARLSTIARWGYSFSSTYTGSYSKPASTTAPENGGSAIVGSLEPNNWGLYDVAGNVWEYCLDYYVATSADYASRLGSGVNIDPNNRTQALYGSGTYPARLGGCYGTTGWQQFRPAFRGGDQANDRSEYRGCRVICTAGLE